ncbi:MAG: GNAT family N-acetyltransferase [Candidatus Thiodiazotropha sp. (ex Monitilora ramsayi)]|nr:GNAT family N-acetyltransferase [Candidatus Thiodiazotropha sp. (ex Monitilora ramsayi)]
MNIRVMEERDLQRVVELIGETDDDDAEDAQNEFEFDGVEHHWVAELEGMVIGVSGYRQVPQTQGTGWVSWTYIDPVHQGKGHGRALFEFVIDQARKFGAEKLFIKVSNYVDENGINIYEKACRMYESFGFECELVSKDFYGEGEDQLIYSMCLVTEQNTEDEKENEKPVIRFFEIFEIAGTEGAYSFGWQVEKKSLLNKRSFSVMDLNTGLEAVRQQGGRIVFLTFLSNLPLIHEPLSKAGFKFVGKLKDYFEPGVHELHFVHRLD